MDLNYVMLDETNIEDFRSVIPEAMNLEINRVIVGTYNNDGVVLGAVSYILMGFEINIDWIYVEPKVRRRGIGLALLEEVFKAVMHTGDRFPVIARYEVSEEDFVLHEFFLSCKHMMTDYSHERYYISPKDLENTEFLHRQVNTNVRVENFFDKSENEQKTLLADLDFNGTYTVSNYDAWKSTCVPELCKCAYSQDELTNIIFITTISDEKLEVSYLYSHNPKALFEILASVTSDIERLFPNASLMFDVMNEESNRIATHLFPKHESVHIYESEF